MDLTADKTSGSLASATPAFNASDLFWQTKGSDYIWTNSYTLNYNPSSTINSHLLTFEMSKLSSPTCAFPGDAFILMELSIKDKDGKKPEDDALVAPINLFPSAMFRGVRMFFNEVEVSNSEMGTYPLKTYVNMLTNMDYDSKSGHTQAYGFYPDLEGEYQTFDVSSSGFQSRREIFGKLTAQKTTPVTEKFIYFDKPSPVYCRLWTDFSTCSLPLLPEVTVRIEMTLNDPAFYMTCSPQELHNKKYSLHIESAVLAMPVKTMATGLALDLEKKLLQKPVAYPLRRVETKKITLPASIQTFTTDGLTQSSLNPDRIMLLFITSENWEPNYGKNPLELLPRIHQSSGDADLTRCSLTVNGTPQEQGPVSSSDQLVLSAFRMMYQNLGQLDKKTDCAISLRDFTNGKFMILYDLTASGRAANSSSAKQPAKTGNLRLDLHWSKPLPKALNLFIFSEFSSSVTIDKNRSVSYQWLA